MRVLLCGQLLRRCFSSSILWKVQSGTEAKRHTELSVGVYLGTYRLEQRREGSRVTLSYVDLWDRRVLCSQQNVSCRLLPRMH